jgi:hypothetical protein
MQLVIEEARDHTECMDKLRARYGADCVVVHSFKTDDRYRVIIALETPSSLRSISARDLQVKNVVSQSQGRSPTFWLADDDQHADLPAAGPYLPEESVQQVEPEMTSRSEKQGLIPAEITAELLQLAARVKALESAQIEQRLAPEPRAAQSLLFSDVLKDTVGEISQGSDCTPSSAAPATVSERAPSTDRAKSLTPPIGDLIQQALHSQAAETSVNKHLTRPVSNVSLANEARSFVNASRGAASFAALLTDHLASSRNGAFNPHFEMAAPGH